MATTKTGASLTPFPSGADNGVLGIFDASDRTAAPSHTGRVEAPSGATGAVIIWDINSVPDGDENAQLFIDIYNPTDKDTSAMYQTGTVTTVGCKKYCLYPGAVDSASPNFTSVVKLPVPRYFRVRMTHSASGTWNYSVGLSFLP